MFKIRPGIVLTHVCDQNVLVAGYEARQHCPYVTILNDTGEIIFNCLKEGKNMSEIIQEIIDTYDIPPNVNAEELTKNYIKQLYENGYIIYEEEKES